MVYIGDADKVKPGLQKGVFAAQDIAAGEVIFTCTGEVIHLEIKTYEDSLLYPNALGLRRHTWLNPPDSNPLRYLNHSCEPNAGIQGSVTIVASQDIPRHTHITIDYSTTECDERWILADNCQCGASSCRKIIRSIQSLPLLTYKSYLPYIPRAFQKEYEAVNGKLT